MVTRRWPAIVEAELRARYDVTLNPDDRPLAADALGAAMRAFDAICPTVTDRIDENILGSPGRARIVANYGAGTDHIDLRAAAANGLTVTNTPDVLTEATADLALLLLLMVSRRALAGERELRDGAWRGWAPTHLVGIGLTGKALGIVGFGRIGRAMARRGAALGMTILYHSTRPDAGDTAGRLGATYVATIDELAARADVVSLHCRGGAGTRHLVDARLLKAMKPTAILINTARGSVVDEAALAAALAAGDIAGAGLDVFEHEPAIDPALLAAPNTVLLPHLGSATDEARVAMGRRVIANLDAFFTGGAVPDRVA